MAEHTHDGTPKGYFTCIACRAEHDPEYVDPDEVVEEMLRQPDPPRPVGCPASPTGTHTSQKIVNGNLCCGNCGALLNASTGIKQAGQRAPWLSQEREG